MKVLTVGYSYEYNNKTNIWLYTIDTLDGYCSNIHFISEIIKVKSQVIAIEGRLQEAESAITTANDETSELKARMGIAEAAITSANEATSDIKDRLDTVETVISTTNEETSDIKDRLDNTESAITVTNQETSDIKDRLDTIETLLNTLNSRSTNLGVTLQTICNRIDLLYDLVEDPYKKYQCCFNPDNQVMFCGSQLAIDLGAVEITQGTPGQCLATDGACQ